MSHVFCWKATEKIHIIFSLIKPVTSCALRGKICFSYLISVVYSPK